jgi:hypothetical protein
MDKINKKGQITTGLAITLVATIGISAITAMSAWVLRVEGKTDRTIDKISEIKTEIGCINTKLDFLLGKYGFIYNSQTQKIEPLKISGTK